MPVDPSTDLLEKLCGPVVEFDMMAMGKAREFAAFLAARDDVGASLIELRQTDDRSWVLVEFELDVGQKPVVDIARRERVALGFGGGDKEWPVAAVVRDDFPPNLPHTFLVAPGEPSLLCLSEEPWDEVKRRWSPNLLIRTVRHWFNETAKGELHKADQALEPFVIGSAHQAILPPNFAELCAATPSHLYGYGIDGTPVVRFFGVKPAGVGNHPGFTAAHFILPPQTHGVIRHSARHVADLIALFSVDGFDFKAKVAETLRAWLMEPLTRETKPVIIVSIPITRGPDGPVERTDTRLFMLAATVRELGVSLDIWSAIRNAQGGLMEGPTVGAVNPTFDGTNVAVMLWSTLTDMTREAAARYNGYDKPSGCRILAVGAGALGSQVVGNLVRMGETVSGVADNDLLLPHNLARHGCHSDQVVGIPKSKVVTMQANDFLNAPAETVAFNLNVLHPGGPDAEAYHAAVEQADVILDLAASVAASRSLSIDTEAKGRRAAAFLSPNGYDLVVMVEGAARTARLDHLEMSYYAAVATAPELDGHLQTTGHVRYGQSCRDLSSQIEQAHVAINAGIAAKVLRTALGNDAAFAKVWRTDPSTMATSVIELDLRPMQVYQAGGWTILVRPGLLETIWDRREERLPEETGGVLLGDFDTSRKLIYLVDALGTPADSKEERGSFVRGAYGLPEAVAEVEAKTQQMLRYAGEWHSHPTGYGVMPSGDDVGLYGYMAKQMSVEGYPPIMLIAGDNEFSLIVEDQRIPLDRLGER